MFRRNRAAGIKPDRSNLYGEITQKIIAELETGRVPWVRPWETTAVKAPLAMPQNAVTGRHYSGINVLLLWSAVCEQGFTGHGWLTYRQARSLGGNVRKGERGTAVVFADRFVPADEKKRAAEAGENARAIPFLRSFTVFNTNQCENLPEEMAADVSRVPGGLVEPRVEALIRATGIDFRIGGDLAFYSPRHDFVQVPLPQAYLEPVNWHRTALHELGHATGHSSRLGRDLTGSFGSPKYAFEELIAEITAAFCCASLGIVPTVRHADYIALWTDVLRRDNRAIIRAASRASRAADYLLAFLPEGTGRGAGCGAPGDIVKGVGSFGSARVAKEEGGSGSRDGSKGERGLSAPVVEIPPMASTPNKIRLSGSRDIPFNKLVLSQSNIRRIKAGVSIEELAEDIARRGLLQSLNVRPILDAEGKETGMFEIPAGGRRYRALELLAKKNRLAKTALVPCVVREAQTDIPAEEDSLIENIQRMALHPLDQFRAFKALREAGLTEEEIAARFFVSVAVVKQRLRLAAVSPVLLDVYADDGMTLEMLMAFTVNPDHRRQEQVWKAIRHAHDPQPYRIRQVLTESAVPASDRRARFVTIDAYTKAGGCVLRALFEADKGGWLEDVGLLDRLVAEKLKVTADEIANEGWKWVVTDVVLPYGYDHGLRKLAGAFVDLTDAERAQREALRDEYDRIEAEYLGVGELPSEIDERLGEIETALAAVENRPRIFDPQEIARSGVFISIGSDGSLLVDRGYVRPEDEAPAADARDDDDESGPETGGAADPVARNSVVATSGQPAQPEEREDEEVFLKPLPERLVVELSAHRTLALRERVASHPHVALTALLHKLVIDTFGWMSHGSCVEAFVRKVHFPIQAADLNESLSAKALDGREDAWKSEIPFDDDDTLWQWIGRLDDASRLSLLAHCVSYGVNALHERPNPHGAQGVSQHGLDRRLREADRLARATGLDMAKAGWRPTVGNYLGRVTKSRILDAVREGAGERPAQLIEHLKKGDMAQEAERLLADTGWLPEPLRLIAPDQGTEPACDGDADGAALPAFPAEDGHEAPADAEEDEEW